MKRDMDLARLILVEIEKSPYNEKEDCYIDGYDKATLKYNVESLLQAGMIEKFGEDITGVLIVGQTTWEGCDYPEKIRDNSLWGKTKDAIKKKGLLLVIDTIKTVANAFITAAEGVANPIVTKGGVN